MGWDVLGRWGVGAGVGVGLWLHEVGGERVLGTGIGAGGGC